MFKTLRRQANYLVFVIILLILLSGGIFLFTQRASGNGKTPVQHRSELTPTSPLAPSPSATPPLFVDDFTDNSRGWYTGKVPGYSRIISDSGLTLSDTNHKVLVESLPASGPFTDFAVTTTFVLQEADAHDSVGLYLRGDNYLDHDYRIEIFGNNTYAICKEWLDTSNNAGSTFLVAPRHTALLKPVGQPNTVAVQMKGATLTLFINNVQAYALMDADYSRGQIALFVENGSTSSGVIATFSHIDVYPLLDQSEDDG